MLNKKIFFGVILTSLHLLIFVEGYELLNNKCDFSQVHQILTCIDLDVQNPDVANLIKPDTHLLIIKGVSNLEISENYHSNKNFQHIKSYQLVNNGVIKISSFAFKELENLRFLKIANNKLWSVLHSNTFSGLSRVETLNIANNSIERLENDAFEGLSNLDILDLTYNRFKIVPSSIFKSLQSVTSLLLYHNNIEILENGCFEGLFQIQLLDITHNKLSVIKTSTFNGLIKLTDLYLSFNEIEVIEGEFALPNLQFLYLQHNKLKSVLGDVFKSAANLKAIDLSYNEISFISDNAFYSLKALDHVNVAHNNATAFVNLKFNDLNRPLLIV